ncbi:MAG: hypothetical protein ACIAXF_04765 [Phycisphaerales bacterium JB063]
MTKPARPTRIGTRVAWLLCAPLGWVAVGVILIGVWWAGHLLGWRFYTSALSGTPPAAGDRGDWLTLLGLVYAVMYFTAVLIAPVLILAGLMRFAALRLLASRLGSAPTSESPADGAATVPT